MKKEEQKQHLIDMMNDNEDLGLYDEIQPEQNLDNIQNPQLNIGAVICSACGAENSMHWEKIEIGINDKQGSYKDLTFDFCEECGNVTNADFS